MEMNGTRYWSSRERTEDEKKLLRSLLNMKADEMNGRTSNRIVGKRGLHKFTVLIYALRRDSG